MSCTCTMADVDARKGVLETDVSTELDAGSADEDTSSNVNSVFQEVDESCVHSTIAEKTGGTRNLEDRHSGKEHDDVPSDKKRKSSKKNGGKQQERRAARS
ncbi:MAG: hypothetical protein IKP00_00980 [Victivallales bacterium]|nr:hypothetical protein [Victivallales bacterium]